MATIRLEVENGCYKAYIDGNTTDSCVYPLLVLRELEHGAYSDEYQDPLRAIGNYPDYITESVIYLIPGYIGYSTTYPGSYNVDRYAVVWAYGALRQAAASLQDNYHNYLRNSVSTADSYARDYFSHYYEALHATPLSTPIGLNATNITSNSALLGWAQNANASNFKIEYKINGDTTWTQTTSD